jgi:hypothetical protein
VRTGQGGGYKYHTLRVPTSNHPKHNDQNKTTMNTSKF